MMTPQKRRFRAFLTRFVILLVVYLLAVVGFLALLKDLLPSPSDHPWLVVLYAGIVIGLFAAIVLLVEFTRKQRK